MRRVPVCFADRNGRLCNSGVRKDRTFRGTGRGNGRSPRSRLLKYIRIMANIITFVRVVCSAALLFCRAFSAPFYVLYMTAGFTDMIDGAMARKTGTAGEFGSKLDTAADLIFTAVCMIKLVPVLNIESWMFVSIGIIAVIKMINFVSGFVVQKKTVTVHSAMNKITGGLLFLLPLTAGSIDLRYSAAVVCAVAAFAAVQEGHYIRTGRIETKNDDQSPGPGRGRSKRCHLFGLLFANMIMLIRRNRP